MTQLETILDYFYNPSGKLVDKRGRIAFAYGQDGGEVLFMIIHYDTISKKWIPAKRCQRIDDADDRKPIELLREEDLIVLALKYEDYF